MAENGKSPVREYLICACLIIAFAIFLAFADGLFESPDAKSTFGILCDCFTVPGVMFFGIGGLSFVSSRGGFDFLSYSMRQFTFAFISEHRRKRQSFYDYKKEREEKGGEWLSRVFISGLLSLALAGIFLVIYFVL